MGMSRRPATVTQADIRRIIRAAKQEGASKVEVQLGDASRIVISLQPSAEDEIPLAPTDQIKL